MGVLREGGGCKPPPQGPRNERDVGPGGALREGGGCKPPPQDPRNERDVGLGCCAREEAVSPLPKTPGMRGMWAWGAARERGL